MSPNVIAQVEGRQGLGEKLTDIIRKAGDVTLRDLCENLSLQGRAISPEAVRLALAPLVKSGEVALEKRPRSLQSKVKVNHYTAAETDDE